MTRKELKNRITELKKSRYLGFEPLYKKAHEFERPAKADKDELACAYADVFLASVAYRSNKLSANTLKGLFHAISVGEKYDEYLLQIEAENTLGIVLSFMVDHVASLEHYEKGFAIAKKHRYLFGESVFSNNICDVYMNLKEYDLALKYAKESYKFVLEAGRRKKSGLPTGYYERITMCFMNMAETYYHMGDYEEAYNVLSNIEKFDCDITRFYFYTSLLVLKALIFLRLGRKDEVGEFLEKVISNAERNVEILSTLDDYLRLADTLTEIDEFDYARRLLNALEQMVEEIDSVEKWSAYLKIRIMYLKKAEPSVDRTDFYEKFFEYKSLEDKAVKDQKISSLNNKRRLEKEIKRRNAVEQKNRKLKVLSEHDALTGLYNRYALYEVGTSWFNEAKSKKDSISVILMDIDYFKEFNDSYGHLEGDEALKTVSAVIKEKVDTNDLAIRYGGDEFFIISHNRSGESVKKLVNEINQGVFEKAIEHKRSDVSKYLTVTFGAVCSGILEEQTILDFIHLADNGLYRAKNERRNALGFFTLVNGEFEYERIDFEK